MRRLHFSIANLLAVIGILGVAMAALRNPSYLWANVTFSIAFGSLIVAVLSAIYAQGPRRAYWLGFSLCGAAYFAVCWMPGLHESVCPRLVSEAVFDLLYPLVAPPEPPAVQPMITARMGGQGMGQMMGQMQAQMGMMRMMTGQARGMMGVGGGTAPASPSVDSRWEAWNAPDRTIGVGYQIGSVSLVSSDTFRQIGHSIVTLLLAMLGGAFARGRCERMASRDLPQSAGPA
jgi:hypothetical protein